VLRQYQKGLPHLGFKLVSSGILKTDMNKKIKALDVTVYPDIEKFHLVPSKDPKKVSEMIYQKYSDYFSSHTLEIDLRSEAQRYYFKFFSKNT
jgi:hypothetical protein